MRVHHCGDGSHSRIASQLALEGAAGLLIMGFGLVLNTSFLRTVAMTCYVRDSETRAVHGVAAIRQLRQSCPSAVTR